MEKQFVSKAIEIILKKRWCILYLPKDVLLFIFSFLNPLEILQVQLVCTKFQRVGNAIFQAKCFNMGYYNLDPFKKYFQKDSSPSLWKRMRYRSPDKHLVPDTKMWKILFFYLLKKMNGFQIEFINLSRLQEHQHSSYQILLQGTQHCGKKTFYKQVFHCARQDFPVPATTWFQGQIFNNRLHQMKNQWLQDPSLPPYLQIEMKDKIQNREDLRNWICSNPHIRYDTTIFADVLKAVQCISRLSRISDKELATLVKFENAELEYLFAPNMFAHIWRKKCCSNYPDKYTVDQLAFHWNNKNVLLMLNKTHKELKSPTILYFVDLTSFFRLDPTSSMETAVKDFHELLFSEVVANTKILLVFNKLDTFKEHFEFGCWNCCFDKELILPTYHHALGFIRSEFLKPIQKIRTYKDVAFVKANEITEIVPSLVISCYANLIHKEDAVKILNALQFMQEWDWKASTQPPVS